MPLQTQIISLPLGAKLDEGTDPKLVNAQSAVLACKNAIFRQDGQVEKAPGYLTETCECIAGGRKLTAYLLRLHSIESHGADLIVGGCGFDSVSNSYGEEYYNAGRRGIFAGATVRTYDRIGKWFPIQQSKSTVAGNRDSPTAPDSAYVAGTVPSVWTAWIEGGAVKVNTCRASDGVALTTPEQWSITGMTTGMERVRVIAVGAYVHVYASSRTELRIAVFSASSYALGATVASAQVHAMCGRAWFDFSTWGNNLDCVIEAENPGWESNLITVAVVADSPPAGGVTIDVTAVLYGYAVVIHFEAGVSTVLDVTNAIDALAGDDDAIRVKAGGYGTPAAVLDAGDDEGLEILSGACYSWDAIKITVAAVDVAIVAYCEDTASQLEFASFTAAGAAGAYGPTAFASYPGGSLAICKCRTDLVGAEGIAVVFKAVAGANAGDVCVRTHTIDAAFTAILAETPFFSTAADFADLTNVTICQERITEHQEAAACPGLAVWAEFAKDTMLEIGTWRHVVRAWVLNANTGAIKRECIGVNYNHRLMSRALEYDRRSHVWICHESETWPVASLVSLGDRNSTVRVQDTEATWLRAVARWPDRDSSMSYGAGLGSITTDGIAAPNAIYWWPAVCAETQDALDVRLNRYDYLATGLVSAAMGSGRVAGGGQLMGLEPGKMRPHGFAYPPEIRSLTATYDEATYSDALTPGGRYRYLAIYEYLDANGDMHQSAPSVSAEVVAPHKPYADGQTLTITAANNKLVFSMGESFGPSSLALVATIPSGTYDTWDALGGAIADAMMDAIRGSVFAPYNIGCTMYAWKDLTPFEGTELQTLIGEVDPAVMKIAYINPGDSGGYLKSIEWSTSTLGGAVGYGLADQNASLITKSWTDLFGAGYETAIVSFATGVYSLDIPEGELAVAVTAHIKPLVPGEYERNVNDVRIAIYRTEADGTTFHRVAELANSFADYDIQAVDTVPDSEALTKAIAYTTGEPGDVLEHTTPVSLIACSHRDRVWCVDEEDPRFVFVSVPKAQGFAVEFTEFIKVALPAPVLALRSAGEVMLAFTADACYAIHGQGPDATGQGEFSAPRMLAPAGVDNHKGVCSLGDLTVWHSASRGLWTLDRGYQSQEIGKHCQALLAGGSTVKSMVEYAAERRLEINLSNGEGIWIDQRHDRWTQQTLFSGVAAACIHQGFPWHISGNQVCYQGGTTWTRGGVAHAMTVKTAWIKVGALSGLQRVRMESILGEWRDSHTIQIKRYLDYSLTAETTRTLAVDADPGPYLIRHHPLTQRCSAVQLEISDVPPVTGGAAFRLTALELECGVKRGYMHKGKDV